MYYLYVLMDKLTLQVVTPTEAWLSLDEIISIYIKGGGGGGGGGELSVSLYASYSIYMFLQGMNFRFLFLYIFHSIYMFLEGMKFRFLFLYMYFTQYTCS